MAPGQPNADWETLLRQAVAKALSGDPEAARALLREVAENDPTSGALATLAAGSRNWSQRLVQHALSEFDRGNSRDAVDLCAAAKELDPENAESSALLQELIRAGA